MIMMLIAHSMSAQAHVADINYGSEIAATGGAYFLGSDGAQVDSISIGYFAGVAANIGLNGWTSLQTDTSFELPNFNSGTVTDAAVGPAIGQDAWVLITDGGVNGLVRMNTWVSITGTEPPAVKPTLSYFFGGADAAANVQTLGNVNIAENAGYGGMGLSFQIVPEPSTYAMIAGFLALAGVLIKRRR